MNSFLKDIGLRVFNKFLMQDEVQRVLVEQFRNYGQATPLLQNIDSPYSPTALGENLPSNTKHSEPIFITSRFRTGSTLLWNLFRQSNQFKAYYEPFNERQWFNTALRGKNVDKTHRGVDNYWEEYNGLDLLSESYEEKWINSSLYMSETCFAPRMRQFIDTLIEKTSETPVLQFNRVDFRLPWLRHNYPKAKIIHLYRNPRDQWCSFLVDKKRMNKDDVLLTYEDNFYLDVWCKDLCKHYPFLERSISPHPYTRFYFLWKLSYLFGVKYSNLSFSYENFVTNSTKVADNIDSLLGLKNCLSAKAESLINVTSVDKWKEYADEIWFYEKELACEKVLADFLRPLDE